MAAKPLMSIKFKSLSDAMEERLDSNRFHSRTFPRKQAIKTAAELPVTSAAARLAAAATLSPADAAARAAAADAARDAHAAAFDARQRAVLLDHAALTAGAAAHLVALHFAVGDQVVPAAWVLAYLVGSAGGGLHVLLLGQGVVAVGAWRWRDALRGAGASARTVLFLPLAAASQHFGQACLPFPLLVAGYFTYQLACLTQALREPPPEVAAAAAVSAAALASATLAGPRAPPRGARGALDRALADLAAEGYPEASAERGPW